MAIPYLRGAAAKRLCWPVAAAHAALGTAGLAILIPALQRETPPGEMGTAGFGPVAALLLGSALVFGLVIGLVAWRRQRPPGVLVGIHASLAIAGFVMLWTLTGLG